MLTKGEKEYILCNYETDYALDKVVKSIIVDGKNYILVKQYVRVLRSNGNTHFYRWNIRGMEVFNDFWGIWENGSEYKIFRAWENLECRA